MLKRFILITLFAFVLSAAARYAHAEDGSAIPEKLKAWKNADYSRRYFLKVEAPGEAGSAGLHADAMFASVSLPLRIIGEGAAAHPEPIALIGEDGAIQPVFVRTILGGSETEIVFATYPGQRRFCLYSTPTKVPTEVSPVNVRPVPLQVHLRGVSADAGFKATAGNPLTLKRFQQLEEQGIAPIPPPKSLSNPDPHPETQPNIDDAECPFIGIDYTIFDVIKSANSIFNPQNYAALYEGFLRCPVSGKYKFAIDTPGVAHLVIDGVPVIDAEIPDEHRDPFALNKSIDLTEGVHRVVVHYAEANPPGDRSGKRTNEDLRRFGIRLHWQPPFSSALMCVPPLAFVKYLPAVVASCESSGSTATPFVHIETLGHVRIANQKGDAATREWVLVSAKGLGLPVGQTLHISAPGMQDATAAADQSPLCAWVPAGAPVDFRIGSATPAGSGAGTSLPNGVLRGVSWPTLKTGLKESVEREVMDLEAELLVKSAPEFLYPNESGHIHVETVLTPKPVIVHKTRFDAKEVIGWELLPPPPRPMGEFVLTFEQPGATAMTLPATPDESERRKLRVSFPTNASEAMKGTSELLLRLSVGGLECQQDRFRLLHAQAASWPGKLVLIGGDIAFLPNGATRLPERVVILVPHQDESLQRILKPMDSVTSGSTFNEALFIGDTLVEGVEPVAGNAPVSGLAAALAKAKPSVKWVAIEVAGPHRYRPVLRMLADLDAYVAANPGKKLPSRAVVNLGSGDVSRQTPLYTFERALDTLLARLSAGGVEHIVVVGVIPEPWRERQCEPYQERVENVVKQHKVSGVDLFHMWTRDQNTEWTQRFVPDGEKSDIAGPVPNSATMDEIIQLILARQK